MNERPAYSRLSQRQLVVVDCLATLLYVGILLAMRETQAGPSAPGWLDYVLMAAMSLPLAVRRLAPVPVFVVVLLASLVSRQLDVVRDSFAAAAFALYVVALTQRKYRREPTLAIGIISALGVLSLAIGSPNTTARPPPEWWTGGILQLALGVWVLGGAWTLGRAVRERRAHVKQLAEQAVAQERLRIARDLHDIVAHSMSLIAVKAGVANHVAQSRPEEAGAALRVIEQTSRGAMAEMRQLLGVLRSEVDGSRSGDAELAPAPGLDSLAELADRAAMAGVRVTLDVDGAGQLPQSTQLSVYRIVQEALTNVVKHAAPAQCRVTVSVAGGEVCVEVTDDGPGRGVLDGLADVGAGAEVGASAGHGLAGMRERVGLYGGSFSAGPGAVGGFAVRARWRVA